MERKFIILTAKGVAECQTEEFDAQVTDLKENEAIIDTSLSLISAGTELSRVYAIKQGFSYPVYPGYSCIGKVLAKGSGLEGIETNDRVFYSGVHASVNRFDHEGTTQGRKIMKINPALSDKQASLIPLGLIAINAITACNGKLTESAAVFGLGTIGLMAALMLQKQGLRTVVVDPVKSRCELAEKLGLHDTICCEPKDQVSALKAWSNQKGVDICVDVSGISGAIVNAVEACAKHGQVILLGSPRAAFETDITPILNAIHMKMLHVQGAFNELNPYPITDGTRRSVLRDFEAVERLILDGTLDADKLVSHIVQPEEIASAYHGLMYDKENYHCVLIDWKKQY